MFCRLIKHLTYLTLSLYLVFTVSVSASGTELSEGNKTEGKKIYKEYCRVCHGDNGTGKTFIRDAVKIFPPDFTAKNTIEKLSFMRMKMSIYYGRPSTAMVGWENDLSDQQINDVISFIRDDFMKLTSNGPQNNTIVPVIIEHPETRADSGLEIYGRFCYHCHGVKGDGDMPVKSAMQYPPRDFTNPVVADTMNTNQMFYGIKDGIKGTGMPSWKMDLTDDEIKDVIVYIQESFMNVIP